MTSLPTIASYLIWHYTKAFRDLIIVWGNITWAVTNFFSIPLLLRTFFAPWKRMEDEPEEGNTEDFFATALVNFLSRIVGAFVRFWIVLIGLFALVGMLAGLLVVLVVWLLAPFIALALIVFGFTLLSNAL